MRTIRTGCLCVGLTLAGASPGAHAEGWSPREAQWGQVALGFVSGFAAHELGHVVVARSKGYRVSHDGISIVYPGAQFTPSSQLQLASAGFQTQWVLSEFVLRDSPGQEHRLAPTDFGAGVVLSCVGLSAAYLTILKNESNGDVYGMSRASGLSHDRIAWMLAVPAFLDAWRLIGDDVPSWVPAVSIASKGVGAAWIWSF